MQPASKPKTLKALAEDDEPPTKMQAIEIPEGESDGEYEAVPKKLRQKSPAPPAKSVEMSAPIVEAAHEQREIDGPRKADAPDATDDDWLRSRTSRLLDLMDPDEIGAAGAGAVPTEQAKPIAVAETPVAEVRENEEPIPDPHEDEDEDEKPDPTIEAIKATGRLFARNLPYSATEDDLREHFAPFGSLEEVCVFCCNFHTLSFHDEYPDRDSLSYKHVMRTGRKF